MYFCLMYGYLINVFFAFSALVFWSFDSFSNYGFPNFQLFWTKRTLEKEQWKELWNTLYYLIPYMVLDAELYPRRNRDVILSTNAENTMPNKSKRSLKGNSNDKCLHKVQKKRQRKFDEAIPYPTGNSDQQIKVKISDTGNSKQIPPICNLTTQNIDMILL